MYDEYFGYIRVKKDLRKESRSFARRLATGSLRRPEQAAVGAVGGFVCGVMLAGIVLLGAKGGEGSNTLTPAQIGFLLGSIGAAFGLVIGYRAEVHPEPPPAPEARVEPGPREEWILAGIWAPPRSTRNDLRALGLALEAWRVTQSPALRLDGLEQLLSGLYPSPDGPTPYRFQPPDDDAPIPGDGDEGWDRLAPSKSIVEPWVYCPVIVWGPEDISGEGLRKSLIRSLPATIVGSVGYPWH